MPKLHELVYVYNKKIFEFMVLFTGTLPVNKKLWTGIVLAKNLLENQLSGIVKLTLRK